VVPVRLGAVESLGRAAAWFPLVGALVGGAAGGVHYGLEPVLGRGPATVLALIVLVGLTGALHQDGLADTADGLGVRGDRERRLAAMRDSAIGVFGALALVGWAMLMFTSLTALSDSRALAALVAAAALGRWAAVVHAVVTRPARTDGLGASFEVGRVGAVIATMFALAAALAVCGPSAGAAAIGAAVVVAAGWSWASLRTFGGRTGDTLGACVALVEVAVCVVVVGVWAA
jgi:adenosylcobinamide-GDP ribazoletransferase